MIPFAFQHTGPRPEANRPAKAGGPDCRTCGNSLATHTGRLCAICRAPIEHHDQPRPNNSTPAVFADCLAGRIRMATARHAAGVPLDDVDRAALATTVEQAA